MLFLTAQKQNGAGRLVTIPPTLVSVSRWHLLTLTKLPVLCSAQQLRLFRRAAPYPTREERTEELKDALDRYQHLHSHSHWPKLLVQPHVAAVISTSYVEHDKDDNPNPWKKLEGFLNLNKMKAWALIWFLTQHVSLLFSWDYSMSNLDHLDWP